MAWRVPPGLAGALIAALYRLWCASLRLTYVNKEPTDALLNAGTPFVIAMWHNELFTLCSLTLKKRAPLMAVVSRSRDGAYMAAVLERLGYVVARGSSSRGGAGALLACIRHMREDSLCPGNALDGPRGPRHQTKDGAISLAWKAEAPILPLRAFPEHCFRFKSWDRFELPLPFSKVRVVYGDPYTIDRELDAQTLAEERDKLNRAMNDLEGQ
jgi:lysophospholipid acyltransferase (LPLAT)-like uncharacterized protein